VALRIHRDELTELPIPIPGSDLASLTQEVREVKSELSAKIEKINDLQSSLFNLDNGGDEAGKGIRKLAASAEVLSAGLSQSDDLSYRIRNFYPFPLAYIYRSLQAIGGPGQRHDEILRVIENVVAFLASVGLGVGRYEGIIPHESNSNLTAEALEKAWRGGIALGTWKTLAHSTARELRGSAKTDLGADYSSIWFAGSGQSELDQRIDQLVEIRNHARHGRGPTTRVEFEEEVQKLSEQLRAVYEEIDFFINYPLHYVRKLDAPWDSQKFEVESLAYIGDHPGMSSETAWLDYPVSRQVLYIESGSHEWIPLHPIVSVQHCPQCKRKETYMLDKWTDEEKFSLKSFERGHGITASNVDIGSHVSDLFEGRQS
jgi:hypothetical protein